jgi:hypothetical protein
MTEQDKKYLSDILRAIELTEQFSEPIITFSDYLKDLKTQSAIERQLSIIGEAVNHRYIPRGKLSFAKCRSSGALDPGSAPEGRGIIPSAFGGIVQLANFNSLRS